MREKHDHTTYLFATIDVTFVAVRDYKPLMLHGSRCRGQARAGAALVRTTDIAHSAKS